MKQMLDGKARGLTPVCNDEAAGAIPAESKSSSKRDYGDKSASGYGCDCGLKAESQKASGCGSKA